MTKLVSLKEASEVLGVKVATLRAWQLRRKHLPFTRCGRSVKVSTDAIQKFIDENTIPVRERRS